jgi:dTDP-glucose 4,6-dehydratase
MKQIFVLGSNSPAAANFCKFMCVNGYRVHAFSRSEEKHQVFLPYTQLKDASVTFRKLDLNHDIDILTTLLEKHRPEFVVNFASQAMVAESWEHPIDWMQTNVVSVTGLLETLRKVDNLERYIHFSTPEVYGSTSNWVVESTNYQPSSPYALSRAAGDMLVDLWAKTYGLPAVITRAANFYGAGQQLFRIIPRTFLCCLTNQKLFLQGGGFSERAFIHFDDVSRGVSSICEDSKMGEHYHLSPADAIRIRDLVQLICNISGKDFNEIVVEDEPRLGHDQSYLLDSKKIEEELGWRPQVSLENGLLEVHRWCSDNLQILMKQPQAYLHKV